MLAGASRAIAERLGRARANVAITYSGNQDKAERLSRRLEVVK
ncbi:hypothetical protein [Leptolyngbya sp. Cla-17]|nr:hypothetical protein [Leptolyngbya sp. Cla-17]